MSNIKTWQERCLERGIGSCEARDEELIELRAALKERDAEIARAHTNSAIGSRQIEQLLTYQQAQCAVMQQALDALELHATQYPHMQKGYTVDAITALKEAMK